MSDVRERLNSHPVPTLRKILSAVAKEVNIKGGFSRTLKTKKELIDYMIKLEKDMAEVSWDKIPLREKPKKEKAPPKPKKEKEKSKKATAQEIKDSLMVPGKFTLKELKEGKALVKNQPKPTNPITQQESNQINSLIDYMNKGFRIRESDFKNKKDLDDTIKALKFSRDKLNRNGRLKKVLERFEKGKPKKEAIKKGQKIIESKKQEPDLLTLMDKFNKKYNAVEIKKQNLNKSNLKDFTEPYFKELEKIEKELENMDDSIEFFKTNKKISSGFVDIRKNFIRRVKAQMKVKKEEPKIKIAKKATAKKSEKKKEKSAVDTIVDLKEAMSPIFDKKFNPKSVIDRIDSMKDIDDINKEITIIQKKVKEVSAKSKSSGKETEAEKKQLQKLQEKYTKRLKSIVNSMKKGGSFL
jgi:hypothetical protein